MINLKEKKCSIFLNKIILILKSVEGFQEFENKLDDINFQLVKKLIISQIPEKADLLNEEILNFLFTIDNYYLFFSNKHKFSLGLTIIGIMLTINKFNELIDDINFNFLLKKLKENKCSNNTNCLLCIKLNKIQLINYLENLIKTDNKIQKTEEHNSNTKSRNVMNQELIGSNGNINNNSVNSVESVIGLKTIPIKVKIVDDNSMNKVSNYQKYIKNVKFNLFKFKF